MQADLPQPAEDALEHSRTLAGFIRNEMESEGGYLPFSRFMERCLYAPGLGYYSAGSTKFGAAGDFVTAPELGPLFATCVADAVAPVLRKLGPDASFVEIGGGSGAFAETMLKRLLELDALPARYAILEPSADLRERQRQRLGEHLIPPLFALLEWIDRPLEDAWSGVLFANEVIDALPTPRFYIRDGEVWEEGVTLNEHQAFVRSERPADALLCAAVRHVERYLGQPFAEGYRSELLPQLPYWIQAVMGAMNDGVMLFVDYGYPRKEYYLPQRENGTLRAFYRQRTHNNVYLWPGLQDITASVDFTALAEAGTQAGFELAGYTNQASFLLGNGLQERLQDVEQRASETAQLRFRNEARQLTLPSEMGERFQVMGFSRGVEFEAPFLLNEMSWRL